MNNMKMKQIILAVGLCTFNEANLQAMDSSHTSSIATEGIVALNLIEQLLEAAQAGNLDQVAKLLSKGADVNVRSNVKNKNNGTALVLAAKEGHKAVCELLLKHNAAIDARSDAGWTALIEAASENHKEICKLLISNGANVNIRNSGTTALMEAAQYGYEEICKLLITNKADVNIKDPRDRTALIYAAKYGHEEVCKLLINAMIKPTKEQVTALGTLSGLQKRDKRMPKDVRLLIAKEEVNRIKQEKKPNIRDQIMKIEKQKLKKELLDYLNSI